MKSRSVMSYKECSSNNCCLLRSNLNHICEYDVEYCPVMATSFTKVPKAGGQGIDVNIANLEKRLAHCMIAFLKGRKRSFPAWILDTVIGIGKVRKRFVS